MVGYRCRGCDEVGPLPDDRDERRTESAANRGKSRQTANWTVCLVLWLEIIGYLIVLWLNLRKLYQGSSKRIDYLKSYAGCLTSVRAYVWQLMRIRSMYWCACYHCSCSSETISVSCTLPACTSWSFTPTTLWYDQHSAISQLLQPLCFVAPLRHCARAFLSIVGMLQLLFDAFSDWLAAPMN